jgi:uncharacterized protein (TIGR03083 family)
LAGVRQYYEAPGVPMVVPASPADVVDAWIAHRRRLRGWLRVLPDGAWDRPTRCAEWCVSDLVQHLISGSQFLGYTLHQSKKGEATRLLAAFDPQSTPGATAAQFAHLRPAELLDALDDVDGRVLREFDGCSASDWLLPAEAPLGRVPAFVSVNHFLFDSWVHERDLMLPAGEAPPVEPNEVSAVASYVVALAGCARAATDDRRSAVRFAVTLTDFDFLLSVEEEESTTAVTVGDAPEDAPTLQGTGSDLVDYATGRASGDRLEGDPAAMAFLRNLAVALA